MDKIYEENGGEKMYMISSGGATAVTHYALSAESPGEAYFASRLHKIIQWSPCNGILDTSTVTDVSVPVELFISFLANGIYRIGGPGFAEFILPGICAGYGEEICAVADYEGQNQANSVVHQMH